MGYEKKETKRHSVFGIFQEKAALNQAIHDLKAQNFRNSDISALMPSKEGTKDFAIEKHTKAPEGATTGAATGLVTGTIVGWLLGAGVLAIPGLGPLIAAGPIIAAIAGAGVGGTVGGLAGGLIGLGIPEFEAQRYEGYVKKGGMLISIHVDDSEWEAKAQEILLENGAINISTTSEKKPTDEALYYRTNSDRNVDLDDLKNS